MTFSAALHLKHAVVAALFCSSVAMASGSENNPDGLSGTWVSGAKGKTLSIISPPLAAGTYMDLACEDRAQSRVPGFFEIGTEPVTSGRYLPATGPVAGLGSTGGPKLQALREGATAVVFGAELRVHQGSTEQTGPCRWTRVDFADTTHRVTELALHPYESALNTAALLFSFPVGQRNSFKVTATGQSAGCRNGRLTVIVDDAQVRGINDTPQFLDIGDSFVGTGHRASVIAVGTCSEPGQYISATFEFLSP